MNRAKVGASAINHFARNSALTVSFAAGLVRFAVRHMLILKSAALTCNISIIGSRIAAKPNAALKDGGN